MTVDDVTKLAGENIAKFCHGYSSFYRTLNKVTEPRRITRGKKMTNYS